MRLRRDGEYVLMPCMTCKSFDTKIKHDTTTGTPVAGGCHGCGIIYYGQVVFCALHDEIGSPPKALMMFAQIGRIARSLAICIKKLAPIEKPNII